MDGTRVAERRGVLVMAYGTPRGIDDVEAYYTDIRHGRPPSRELLDDLVSRYEAIGGRSPLLDITMRQAEGIGERVGVAAYVGQKHASPFIRDAVERMAEDRVDDAVGIVLAPHFSSMSIGDYERRALNAAQQVGWKGRLEIVKSWHLNPGYLRFLAREVATALDSIPEEDRASTVVLFTAHSLPNRITQKNDPYPAQLGETAHAVAAVAGVARWEVAWQSAGRTDVPWLGPDILDVLPRLADEGVRAVTICPCGFVSDHLEVLYDIDIEAQQEAEKLGMTLVRTRSPNDDAAFLDALASEVMSRWS